MDTDAIAQRETGGMEEGERMFVWCHGGPAVGRAVAYPPPAEIQLDDGIYVLVDDGPPETWRYDYVPDP